MSRNRESRPKKNLFFGLSFAAVAATGALGGTASAQEATTPEATTEAAADEIVVTGFRSSLAAAIDLKRTSVGAIDAIVAEDIADFPDLNLSESIQRIPGVSITRSAGEGRNVSVRGLGPQFTRVRINGMEALSTAGSTDAEGGTNRSRGFDFNIFASDLFNSIIVRKTASADVEEGSLGATVDMRTARPFDYEGFTFAASGQLGYNDLSEEYDPRASFLVSTRTPDGNFGILLSASYAHRVANEEGASTVRWAPGGFTLANITTITPTPAQVNAAFHPRIPRYDQYHNEQDRYGASLALQWRPSTATEISFDYLYALLDGTRTETFLESPVFSTTGASAIGNVDVTNAQIEGNSLVYGVFNDVDIRSEFRYDELSTQFQQATLGIEHEFSERLRAVGFAGYAESIHENPIQTTLLWDHADVDGYVYDYRDNSRLPLITYGGLNVTDPSVWTLSQIRLRPQYADNTYTTASGDLIFDAADWLTLRGGAGWRNYEFISRELRRSNGTTSNQESVIPGFASGTLSSAYAQLIALTGRGLDLPPGLVSSWVAPDIGAAAALWNLYDPSVFPLGIQPALGNNFSIEEQDLGGYGQAEWDIEAGGGRFRGNLGVRYVETEQTSTGYTFSAGLPVLQTVTRIYEDWLPSLNLSLEPINDFVVRFAAARVMSRPNLGQLSPGASVSVSGANKTVTAGNPLLDPFRAWAYDLSFEWYFHEEALLSVAFFQKDIDSFVQTVRTTGPFTGNPLGLPDSVAIAACGPAYPATCSPSDTNWQFSLPRNTPGGPLFGYEISLQLPFYFLPGWLSNFGFVGNYTHVESEIDYVNNTGVVILSDDLTGLSRNAWNGTLYYEDDRFSARVSGSYRSEYLTTIPGRDSNASESTASTFNVDFASSYAINDHLRFTLEGINMTDEVSDQYLSPDDRSSFYHHYGRNIFLGFRYTN